MCVVLSAIPPKLTNIAPAKWLVVPVPPDE
jgi:hypothetical protein